MDVIIRILEVITWPIAVFILGFIFLRWIKQPICDFFGRLVEATALGVGVKAANPQVGGKPEEHSLKTGPDDEVLNRLKDDPRGFFELHKNVIQQLSFERIYNRIYGTQISLLDHLSQKGDAGELYVNLTHYHNEYVKRSNSASYHMKDYIAFLEFGGICRHARSTTPSYYAIRGGFSFIYQKPICLGLQI